jgi:transglutaminase-like putative cysteine protease
MIFRVLHTTTYSYSDPVSISFHEAVLTPRQTGRQTVLKAGLAVEPKVQNLTARQDYFDNIVTRFTVAGDHRKLEVESESLLGISDAAMREWSDCPPLETLVEQVRRCETEEDLKAYEYCFASQHAPRAPDLAAYARPSFPPGRPFLDGVRDLTLRIRKEFRYDPAVTTISTPVREVLENRHGVCQDFAHVMIGCLRSLGTPARYVSGYLVPRQGVVGDQASHAWISTYCPQFGWVDFDPTNGVVVSNGHLTVAWGRDYADVCPLRGVILGGGKHIVEVAVKVTPSDGGAGSP